MSKSQLSQNKQRTGALTRAPFARIGRSLVVLILLTALVGLQTAPVRADATWTAYNDCQYISTSPADLSTNITQFRCHTASTNNALRKFSDNSLAGATVDIAISGTVQQQITSDLWGANPTAGDAVTVFNPYVTMRGGERLSTSGTPAAAVTLTFKNLDPNKTYTFATSANRANSGADYANRTTKFTLSDVDTTTPPTNTSSTGVTKSTTSFTDDGTTFLTGQNTTTGYIARWEGIRPGADGDFVVTATRGGSNYGYGPAVFLLSEEENPTAVSLASFGGQTASGLLYAAALGLVLVGAAILWRRQPAR
jgi:hypothetical protein